VLMGAGLEPAPNSPQEMQSLIAADTKRWGQLIEAAGLKAQ
jgi:tripartite-type tricarboxylate transporter receptor subunit TctC